MKYFGLTFAWTVGFAASLFFMSVGFTGVDPTDDFSFSLRSFSKGEVYHLMPEHRVSEILKDRLDLFPQSQIPRLARHIFSLCQQYRFDPAFILSLIEVESGFHVKATSPVGALGLMQVMIPTANFVIRELGLYSSGYENSRGWSLRKRILTQRVLSDPFVNTAIGIAYLAWLRDYYKGASPYHLLAAYNVGPARLDELLARKSFQPVETKKYFLMIRRGIPYFRFYRPQKNNEILSKAKPWNL